MRFTFWSHVHFKHVHASISSCQSCCEVGDKGKWIFVYGICMDVLFSFVCLFLILFLPVFTCKVCSFVHQFYGFETGKRKLRILSLKAVKMSEIMSSMIYTILLSIQVFQSLLLWSLTVRQLILSSVFIVWDETLF